MFIAKSFNSAAMYGFTADSILVGCDHNCLSIYFISA